MDPILIPGHPRAIELIFRDDPEELRDDSGTIFSKNVIFVKNCCGDFEGVQNFKLPSFFPSSFVFYNMFKARGGFHQIDLSKSSWADQISASCGASGSS